MGSWNWHGQQNCSCSHPLFVCAQPEKSLATWRHNHTSLCVIMHTSSIMWSYVWHILLCTYWVGNRVEAIHNSGKRFQSLMGYWRWTRGLSHTQRPNHLTPMAGSDAHLHITHSTLIDLRQMASAGNVRYSDSWHDMPILTYRDIRVYIYICRPHTRRIAISIQVISHSY